MSDATDQSESKRKHIMEYNAILGDIEVEHQEYQSNYLEKQKDKILRLAKILDESGHPKETICSKVSKDVSKYDIKERYVQKILPDEYKREYKKDIEQSNRTNIRPRAHLETEDQKEKPIAVTNIGTQEIDSIYGKSKEQMRLEAEADQEIAEDKEWTLENPANMLRETPNPAKEPLIANNSNNVMISDSSPELRDMFARVTELEESLRIQKEEAESKGKMYAVLHSKWIQNSPENLLRQIEEYKHTIRKMQEIVDVNNEQIKSNFDYKVFEILKLNTKDITLIQQNSWRSEKSVFLLVNPKSHEILDVKTDKEMHRIQSQRRRQETEPVQQTKQEVQS